MAERVVIVYGLMTREVALAVLADMIDCGEVDQNDAPLIETHEALAKAKAGQPKTRLVRYCITVLPAEGAD